MTLEIDNEDWMETSIPGRNDTEVTDQDEAINLIEELEASEGNTLTLESDEVLEEEVEAQTDENDADLDEERPEEAPEAKEADSKEEEDEDSSVDETPDTKEKRKEDGTRSQKRIQKLARQKNEYKSLYEDLQKQLHSEKTTRVEAQKADTESKKKHLEEQVDVLSGRMKEAMDLGDSEKFVDYQKKFNEASIQRMALDTMQFEEVPTEEEFMKATKPVIEDTSATDISDEGHKWLSANKDKLQDPFNQQVAVNISNQLDVEGFDENTADYFTELSKRLGEKLVDFKPIPRTKPKTTKAQVTSGSATTPAPRSKDGLPNLTDVQKQLAREMGLPLKVYAQQLKKYNSSENQKYVDVKVR